LSALVWRKPSATSRPRLACVVLQAGLKLRFAEADDHDLVRRIQLVQPLPGLQRAPILARARGQCRQLLQRASVPGEPCARTIERGRGLGAVAEPRLTFDQ